MGLMIALMMVVGISNLFSSGHISKQVGITREIAYPLAINSMDLQLWMERSLSTINAAASAGRSDLLEPLIRMDIEVKQCLDNIEMLVLNDPRLSEKIHLIDDLYQTTKHIGLDWVESTLAEDWDQEPIRGRDFSRSRHELTQAISGIKDTGVKGFSNSMDQISNQTKRVWELTVGVFSSGFVFFIALTIHLYRSITTPIQQLLSVIKDIRKNETDFSRRVAIRSFDEIGQLGTAFNGLLDDLEGSQKKIRLYTEELEDGVRQRTDQLLKEKEALQESERHLKAIWDSTPSGIILIDAENHRIVDANPYALKLMGRSLSEVKDQVCHKFICPTEMGNCPITDLGKIVDGAERVLLNEKSVEIPVLKTVVQLRKKGRDFLIESFTDIADLKNTQRDLRAAIQEAETANRAKSDFLANMSHELRTPLNHIIGFTEMVLDQRVGNLNEQQEEFLSDVHTSSKHLLSLINDILDLSKIEAGKLELEASRVDLKMLLDHSLIMIKQKALKEGIELAIEADDIPETIMADERKLKQIMYNLLSNAVKFTPGGGKIAIWAKRISNRLVSNESIHSGAGNGFVEIAVIDSGIGIAENDLERIFQPFEQAKNSPARKYQGTGLGLSLTRSLVNLHGGKIWAESEASGRGSTFRFILPVAPK